MIALAVTWLTAGSIPHYVYLLAGFVFLWEFWLGKTKKIAASSTVEMIGNAVAALLRKYVPGVAPIADAIEKPLADGNVVELQRKPQGGHARIELLVACAVAVGLAVMLAGCGPAGKVVATDVSVCALDQLPGAIVEVIPEIVAALQGSSADWAAEIAKLESRGVAFAICAVKAALADVMRPHGFPQPNEQIATIRAQDYLAQHGVK